eukprot:8637767-Prorocentrum_lima.AAC.1
MFRSPATSGLVLTFGFPVTSVGVLTCASHGWEWMLSSPATSGRALMSRSPATAGSVLMFGFPVTSVG